MALNRAAKLSIGLASVFFACISSPQALQSAEAQSTSKSAKAPAAKPVPAAKPEKAAAPVTTLFASVLYDSKWMLCRIEQHVTSANDSKKSKKKSKEKESEGSNAVFQQSYLSQSKNRFLSTPPTDNRGSDFGIQISPDGKLAAFYSDRSGAVNLWMMNSDGSGAAMLTHSDVDIHSFDRNTDSQIQFSPNGKKIAFIYLGRIWKYDISTQALTTLSEKDQVRTLAWTGDGLSLVYIAGASIRKVDPSGTKDKLLLADVVRWPYVTMKKSPPDEFIFVGNGIYLGNASSHSSELLAASTILPNHPKLSKDEKQIAYIAESPDFRRELFLKETGVKRSSRKKDTSDDDTIQITRGGATYPLFAPSGRSLFFLRGNKLWAIHLDGSAPKQLTYLETALPIAAELSPLGVQP